MDQDFDAIIIGAGQAGPPLAGRLTAAGMKVALIERKLVGGTCVNTGCMPTKALVASAYAAHMVRRQDLGVVGGNVRIDMAAVAARAQKVASDARKRNEAWLEAMEGLTFFRGHARLAGPGTVTVDDSVLQAPRIFLNVGGRASVPDMPGVGDVPHLDNTDMVALDRLPEHLVIVGGSYIGLEFAQMFARFGSTVTVVERASRLIAREDPEISDMIRDILEMEGVTIRTDANCIAFRPHSAGVAVSVDCNSGDPEVIGSEILLAVGRRPNTDDLGLENAGVRMDERGYIIVDDKLQTNVSGIWALGDCNGRGAFTHTAYNDYEIIAANLLDGDDRGLSQRVPGYALYTDPPLGRAGLTETEARAKGYDVMVSTRPMSRVGRAVEKGETLGMMKIIADRATRHILGAAFLGAGGDEAIHGILDTMSANQPLDMLRWAVPVHPTVSELIPTLLVGLTESDVQ